jgi:AcrR family transcriptional regulator
MMIDRNEMKKRDEIDEKIIEYAKERFFKHGFKKVTMDELAAGLQMSKKTIYAIFPTKQCLVESVIESQLVGVMRTYKSILDAPSDLIEKLYQMWLLIGRNYIVIGKVYRNDLRPYHQELWKQLDEARETVFHNFISFFDEGKFLRLIRSDIHNDIILPAYLGALENVMHESKLSRFAYAADDAFYTISTVMFEGLLSESGRRQFTFIKTKER